MLYNGENPVLKIVGVEHMGWSGGRCTVAPREYSALTFRVRGNVTVGCGGKEYFINTNDILYLPQNVGYTAEYSETEIIVIHFITEKDDNEIEIYSSTGGEDIYKMFLRAHEKWKNKSAGYEQYTMAALYNILGTILETETNTSLPEHFIKAVSLINSDYKNGDLCVDEVCSKAGIGRTVFRSLFKKYYQKTPTEYITQLKIENARNLIAGGETIENAAYESGFNDPKYFARVVKKYFGHTPREFKFYGK